MKYIITESQIKKFNKENINQGKYGKDIDRLVLSYLDSNSVCDVITINIEDGDMYSTLILYNGPSPLRLETKLMKFIQEFIPARVFVMVTDTECRDI